MASSAAKPAPSGAPTARQKLAHAEGAAAKPFPASPIARQKEESRARAPAAPPAA